MTEKKRAVFAHVDMNPSQFCRVFAVGEENVVGGSDVGLVLADRDSEPRVKVQHVLVLHSPAGCPESFVDPVAGDLFRGLIDVRWHAIAHASNALSRMVGSG